MKDILIKALGKAGNTLGKIIKILGIITLILVTSLIVQACGVVHIVFG